MDTKRKTWTVNRNAAGRGKISSSKRKELRRARNLRRKQRSHGGAVVAGRIRSVLIGTAMSWLGLAGGVVYALQNSLITDVRFAIPLTAGLLIATIQTALPWRRFTARTIALAAGSIAVGGIGVVTALAGFLGPPFTVMLYVAILAYVYFVVPFWSYVATATGSLVAYSVVVWQAESIGNANAIIATVAFVAAVIAIPLGVELSRYARRATQDSIRSTRKKASVRHSDQGNAGLDRTPGLHDRVGIAADDFSQFVETTAARLEASVCVILLHRPEEGILEPVSPIWAAGQLLEAMGYEQDVSSGWVAKAVRAEQPLTINSISGSLTDPLIEDLGITRLAAIPLRVESRTAGVLMVANKPTDFDENDERSLEHLARPAVLALESFGQIERSIEKQPESSNGASLEPEEVAAALEPEEVAAASADADEEGAFTVAVRRRLRMVSAFGAVNRPDRFSTRSPQTGRRITFRISDHFLDRYGSVLAFAVPAGLSIEFQAGYFGHLLLGEPLALVLMPLVVQRLRMILADRFVRLLSYSVIAWLAGLVATEFWRGPDDLQNALKGLGEPVFVLVILLVMTMLVAGRPERARLAMLGLGIGYLLRVLVFVDTGSPWRLGGTFALALVVLVGLTFTRVRRPSSIFVIMVILSGLAAFFGARGLVAVLSASALYVPITRFVGIRAGYLLTRRQVIGGLLLGILFASLVAAAYGWSARAGLLGADQALRYERQATGSLGVLIGGRTSLIGSLIAVSESPLIGHGSRVFDAEYSERTRETLEALGYDTLYLDLDPAVVLTHGALLQAWVSAGILGIFFWIVVLRVAARAVFVTHNLPMRWQPLVVYLAGMRMWSVAVSPFGSGPTRLALGTTLVFLIVMTNHALADLPPDRRWTLGTWGGWQPRLDDDDQLTKAR